jgi:hypothetical protein
MLGFVRFRCEKAAIVLDVQRATALSMAYPDTLRGPRKSRRAPACSAVVSYDITDLQRSVANLAQGTRYFDTMLNLGTIFDGVSWRDGTGTAR